jgi:capsular polysaccharide biosynthesis protein
MSKKVQKIKDVEITPDGYLFKGGRPLAAGLFNGTIGDLDFLGRLQMLCKHYIRPRLRQPNKLLQDLYEKPAESSDKNCFWITDNWSHGYYHWIADSLPRIINNEEFVKGKTLLLPASLKGKEFVSESLRYFEIGEIKYIDSKHKTFVKNISILPHVAPSGVHDKDLLVQLRRKFRTAFDEYAEKTPSGRLYISRTRADRRRVVNEKEIAPILERYGFKIVCFEDLSWNEQVKKCLNAEIIVGPHGAGLVNMLFMKEEGGVLEFVGKKHHNQCYRSMANKLDLEYCYQECEPGKNSSVFTRKKNKDLVVDSELLQDKLSALL